MTELENITYAINEQSIGHREIYKHNDIVIKLELKADNHKPQSHATAWALDGFEWKLIYSIPYAEIKTEPSLAYLPQYRNNVQKAEKEFKADVDRLKKFIAEIL